LKDTGRTTAPLTAVPESERDDVDGVVDDPDAYRE